MSYLLRLLGGRPELWLDSELLYKQLAPLLLLSYLSQVGESTRLDIANTFWPDLEKQDRLARLSEVLRLLEKSAPGCVLKLEDESKIKTNVDNEVAQLKEAAHHGNYEDVLRLYSGHFLYNVEKNKRLKLLDNSDLYDWLMAEREAILDIARAAIIRFAEIKATQGYYKEANKLALKAFKLQTEQSIVLPPSYQKIYTVLRAGQSLEAERVAREAVELYELEPFKLYDSFQDAQRQLAVPNNLLAAGNLIGRERELAECASLLRNETRLLTVFGTGGTGKSTLGLALARNLQGYENFKDGIYAVWLEQLTNPEDVVTSIAQCLNISISANKTPIDTVADALGDQAILLYLDNFEHLLAATSDLDQLLGRCPNLRIVLSSREVVISDWAKLYDLQGLDFPDENTVYDFDDVASYAAVQLIVEQGKRVSNSFELTEDNFEAVVAICQQVGGLALGLKLAASWLHSSSAQAIAEELQGSMALLDNVQHNQRGVSTALDLSWQRLTDAEQDAFCKLVVFNGGFNLKALQSICEVKLTKLSSLQNKSLIEWDAGKERYSLHPLIRRFVELKAEASVLEGLKLKHSSYYLKLLRIITDGTQEERNGAVRLLKPEVYNIQDAWQQAVVNQDLDELRESAHAVQRFLDETSNLNTGIQFLQNAIIMLNSITRTHSDTLASLLAHQAWLYYRLGNYNLAIGLAENALKLSKNDFQTQSTAINVLAGSNNSLKNFAIAKSFYQKGLEISKDHPGYYATVLSNLGLFEQKQGNFDNAKKHYVKCLEIRKELNQLTTLPSIYNNLGLLNLYQSDFEEAEQYFNTALNFAKEVNSNKFILIIKRNLYTVQFHMGDDETLEANLTDLIKLNNLYTTKGSFAHIQILILLIRVLHSKNKYFEALDVIEVCIGLQEQQNSFFALFDVVICFLETTQCFHLQKIDNLYIYLNQPHTLKKMDFHEKKALAVIKDKTVSQFDTNSILDAKLEQVTQKIERWVKTHLS